MGAAGGPGRAARRARRAPRHEKRNGRGARAAIVDYLTSFQNAAFRRQAISVKAARNSITHTPMRMR